MIRAQLMLQKEIRHIFSRDSPIGTISIQGCVYYVPMNVNLGQSKII